MRCCASWSENRASPQTTEPAGRRKTTITMPTKLPRSQRGAVGIARLRGAAGELVTKPARLAIDLTNDNKSKPHSHERFACHEQDNAPGREAHRVVFGHPPKRKEGRS